MLREAAMEGQKVQRAANRALNEKSLASLLLRVELVPAFLLYRIRNGV